MNDKERERQIKGMKREMTNEVSSAVANIQHLAKIINNGTGALVYRAITGKK